MSCNKNGNLLQFSLTLALLFMYLQILKQIKHQILKLNTKIMHLLLTINHYTLSIKLYTFNKSAIYTFQNPHLM